ncbi:unnamed protein product [Coccothraustes coccothraustes]
MLAVKPKDRNKPNFEEKPNRNDFKRRAEPSRIWPSLIKQNGTPPPSAESHELSRTKARPAEPYDLDRTEAKLTRLAEPKRAQPYQAACSRAH